MIKVFLIILFIFSYFLIICEFHIRNSIQTHFLVLPGSNPNLRNPSSTPKKKKKKMSNFWCPFSHWSMAKFLMASSLIKLSP